MRAIKIDSVNGLVYAVDVDGNDNKSIASHLNCRWIERVRAGSNIDIWIDEEGFLTRPNPNGYFRVKATGQMLAGHGLILNNDGESSAPATLTIEQVLGGIVFVTAEEAEADPAIDPAFHVTTWDEDGRPTTVTHALKTRPPE